MVRCILSCGWLMFGCGICIGWYGLLNRCGWLCLRMLILRKLKNLSCVCWNSCFKCCYMLIGCVW